MIDPGLSRAADPVDAWRRNMSGLEPSTMNLSRIQTNLPSRTPCMSNRGVGGQP